MATRRLAGYPLYMGHELTTSRRVGWTLRRAAWVSMVVFGALARWAISWVALRLRRATVERRQRVLGRLLARTCRRLGATFVKLGQVLSVRPDLIPAPVRDALAELQDRVGPFDYRHVQRAVQDELGHPPEALFEVIDPYPVASASVAQVHRGRLLDGRQVAVKVLRPGIERTVSCDLAVLRAWAWLVGWIPPLSLLSLRQAMREFSDAIAQQLDLRIEAESNVRFADNFADDATVTVPAIVPELSGRRVLCMEYIVGRRILGPEWGQERAERLCRRGFRMLLRMIFEHGFVHADLHPGNIFVRGDDQLVLLDLGLVARLSTRHREGLIDFLTSWAAGDLDAACEALSHVTFHGQPPRRPDELRDGLAALMAKYMPAALGDVMLGRLMLEVLQLVRSQWSRVDSTLTMVVVALAVVEGTGRQLAPRLQLVSEALPYLAELVVRGRASRRD